VQTDLMIFLPMTRGNVDTTGAAIQRDVFGEDQERGAVQKRVPGGLFLHGGGTEPH
jgi:hypothetical protein